MDISLFALLITVVVCVVTVVLYCLSVRKRLKHVLFIGTCDAGKTTLFSSIVYGNPSSTFTSLNENVSNVQINKKNFVLVDVPGHEKVRNEIIQKYKTDTLALVFVIDSKSVQSDIKDISEFLYNILVDKIFIKNRVRLLIACNKQDATTAKGVGVVTHLLERELNTLTFTRTGALAGLDQSTTSTLTKPGITFTFTKSRLPVDFIEISAINDASKIHKWLAQL
uniref:ADP-ribosylation factor-related protein 1 n=1 Tax=Schistosoma japonicum TaxID=6182 RepID=C1L3Q4_SCHJA|nr:signal recognition particle receptor, B subunit 159 [Schistosoma japonicum]